MKYKITISGNGGRFGVGGLSAEQTSFWSAPWYQEDYLEDVLEGTCSYQELLDDGCLITPEAMITKKYYESTECGSVEGLFEESATINITDETGKEIFKGSLSSYCKAYEDDLPADTEFIHNSDELYVGLEPTEYIGYLYWKELKNGKYIEFEIEDTNFDPCKLSYCSCDLNGEQSLVNQFKYGEITLVSDIQNMKQTSKIFSIENA